MIQSQLDKYLYLFFGPHTFMLGENTCNSCSLVPESQLLWQTNSEDRSNRSSSNAQLKVVGELSSAFSSLLVISDSSGMVSVNEGH